MRKDRFMTCNDAAELQVLQEEIWGKERRKLQSYTFCPTNPKILPPLPPPSSPPQQMVELGKVEAEESTVPPPNKQRKPTVQRLATKLVRVLTQHHLILQAIAVSILNLLNISISISLRRP
jgi:hypothetical protein